MWSTLAALATPTPAIPPTAPVVTLVPPSAELSYSHHVPPPKKATVKRVKVNPRSESFVHVQVRAAVNLDQDHKVKTDPDHSMLCCYPSRPSLQSVHDSISSLSSLPQVHNHPQPRSQPQNPVQEKLCTQDSVPSSAPRKNQANTFYPHPPKPKTFCNPWPSYRTASVSDAWLSYQTGAAIAPHALTPGQSRAPSRAGTRRATDTVAGGGTDEDSGSEASAVLSARVEKGAGNSGDEEVEVIADEPVGEGEDPDTEMEINTNTPLPTKVYAKPELLQVMDGDDEDDWRNPPIRVVTPAWKSSSISTTGDGGSGAGNAEGNGVRTGEKGGEEGGEGVGEQRSVTWLGHAGVLVRIPFEDGSGCASVLFDPIFSQRCSPSQMVGPARQLEVPCTVSELPPIHVCCISHDHYDHLDLNTITDLWKYHKSTIHFFVPFGLKQWFVSTRVPETRITELDWWHETLVTIPSSSTPFLSALSTAPVSVSASASASTASLPASSSTTLNPSPAGETQATGLVLKVAFTPAQHRSGRGAWDQMTTLWGSWCVGVVGEKEMDMAMERGMSGWNGFKVFFGGDTGYRYATAKESDQDSKCPAFQQIADLYSPFSLSLLPISTGSSLPFLRSMLSLSLDQYILTSSLHCSPSDSLEIHSILRARRSLGIHWGTFCDTPEARGTRIELGRCRREKEVGKWWDVEQGNGCFVVADIGETLEL